MSDKAIRVFIIVVSVLVPMLVSILLFSPNFFKLGESDFSFLPGLNAVINSSTAICLILALVFIKKGNIKMHQVLMTSGMILSVMFLLSYVVYHSQTESTHFGGEGLVKYVYFTLLLSHILLSIVVIPFVLFAFYNGVRGNIEKHKKIVKLGYPIWLFVSVSGVLVYLMISPYYA